VVDSTFPTEGVPRMRRSRRRNIREQVLRTAWPQRTQNEHRRQTGWELPARRNHAESAIERTRSGTERRARTTSVALMGTEQNGTSACSRCFKPLPCDLALIGFVKPGRYDTMSKNSAAWLPQREKGGGR